MAEKKVNTTNEEEKKKKKKLFIIFGSILGAGAIAGASVGIYFAVKPKAQPVKVDVPTIEGLTFKNKQAYVGQDYSTEISIDITKTGENRLPDELKSVKSDNRTITDTEYTYDVADNKESANFMIPGKYVEGDIKIDLELVPPGPVLDPLLTIEYEYQDTTDNDTVGFLLANQDGSEVTFDWGDDSELETVTPYTDYEEVLEGSPITHRYKEKPKTGDTYTITVSGDLAVFLASAKGWQSREYDSVIKKGNAYFKSATLYKNFSTLNLMSNEAVSVCALGGFKEDSPTSEFSNISQISFGDEVTNIPINTMCYSKIESVTIPAQITTIESYAFGNTKISEVIFEEGSTLETIEKQAFYNCANLRKITIPHTVKTIGSAAFEHCDRLCNINLHEFNIDDDVPTISNNTFAKDVFNVCFVTKNSEVNSKFISSNWGTYYEMHTFGYGASIIYEENNEEYVYELSGTDSIILNNTTDAEFTLKDTDGETADIDNLEVTNNLSEPMDITYNESNEHFTIDKTYYEEGMVWIKVVNNL